MYAGGILEDGMNGMNNYVSGNTRCVEDVLKLLEWAMGMSVWELKIWYSMKFDRRMMLVFEDDGDIVSMMRGNDGHGYLYVGGMEGCCGRHALVCEERQRVNGEANVDGVVE